MVDISLEILASSVPILTGYLARYRVKTWWCHIDVPPDVTFIKLPRLPMIQPFLIMTGKDTTLFIETWQDSQSAIIGSGGGDGGLPLNKTMFLGMTTCHVDEQLKTPNLNPSVQWVDVHNPVENQAKGKLLVKIDARFCPIISPENSNIAAAGSPSSPHRSTTNQDSPIKMVQSPGRRNESAIYFDNLNGYDRGRSSIQNVTSRKSDTSVYSVASTSSTTCGVNGREQGIQTELSMDKITTNQYRDQDNLSPLEAARNFLRRKEATVTTLPPKIPPRGEGRGGDGNKRAYQLEESVEQVIDILNNARRMEDPPKKPLHHARISGVTKVGLPSLEAQGGSGSGSGFSSKRVSISSTSTAVSSQDKQFLRQNLHVHGLPMEDKPLSRFKEVNFDGNRAKEQAAKVLVMTRQTAQQPAQGQRLSAPPVVTRRRIAAAIFND